MFPNQLNDLALKPEGTSSKSRKRKAEDSLKVCVERPAESYGGGSDNCSTGLRSNWEPDGPTGKGGSNKEGGQPVGLRT